jgi:AbrB family looped-hinge helix DNA binding protein
MSCVIFKAGLVFGANSFSPLGDAHPNEASGRRERGKITTVIIKVNSRNQISLPKSSLEKLNVKAGDHLLLDIQDGIMVLIPQPESYAQRLQSLHPEIWKKMDTEKYLNSEREDWEPE